MELEVVLREAADADEKLIGAWYRKPHVSMYCTRLPEHQQMLGRRVITWNRHDVGYLEWRESIPLPATANHAALPGCIEVQIIIGEPGATGFQIGTRAMQACFKALSISQPNGTIVARVSLLNVRGRNFFERLGFRGHSVRAREGGTAETVMVKLPS